MKIKHIKCIRISCFVLLILLIWIVSYFLYPILKGITSLDGRLIAKEKLSSFGIYGGLIIVIIEALKVFVIMMPGEPIELLSGMCFGPVVGLIVIYIGIFVSTFIIFKIVNKFGKEFVKSLISDEKYEKVNNMLKENPSKLENVLFILYFLPIVPKDFVTYLGGLLPISNRKFLIISFIARFPAVFSSTLIGSLLLDGKFIEMLIIYLITYLITGIFVLIYKKSIKKQNNIINISNKS